MSSSSESSRAPCSDDASGEAIPPLPEHAGACVVPRLVAASAASSGSAAAPQVPPVTVVDLRLLALQSSEVVEALQCLNLSDPEDWAFSVGAPAARRLAPELQSWRSRLRAAALGRGTVAA